MTTAPSPAKTWLDYRAVWRWHFYAGLVCIPFVIVLSVTGAIYLFKPQIEAWSEREFDNLTFVGEARPAAEQIRAALDAFPGSTFGGYELPRQDAAATRVIVRQDGEAIRVYVHPQTLQVLYSFPESQRFVRFLFRLHGELLMGNTGSMIVELAASWTIILILTGLYLWWPRQSRGLGGVAYPRLTAGARVFWRDLHAVMAVWISAFSLFLLLSGLPWAKSWGNYLRAVRAVTGTAVAKEDWSVGSERKASRTAADDHSGHGTGSKRRRSQGGPPPDLAAVERIVATVGPLRLPHPVVIAPPEKGAAGWTAKSMTANRPFRVNLVLDGATGSLVSREDFKNKHLIDKVVSVGIAAHEGQLFGWANQLLGLVTAAGLILVSISGIVMWWRRREQGVLGAPRVSFNARQSFGLLVVVALLGLYLPLFGTSLILVLAVERLVLRHIPGVRHWLGLSETRLPEALS